MQIIVRDGVKEDIPDVLKLIKELALFEKSAEQVLITEEILHEDAFGKSPSFRFLIAETDIKCLGMALFYPKYSTWAGRSIHLEDLIVFGEYRRMGIGKTLLDALITLATNENCSRLEWQVLDWNTSAINFYKKHYNSYGAEFDNEWLNVRINLKK